MIAATSPASQFDTAARTRPWQRAMAEAITDPHELCAALELDPALVVPAHAAARSFRLRVPRGFLARMEKGNPRDPLLLQVLPVGAELAPMPGFDRDPVGDLDSVAARGLLHKYHGRALLVATGACAIHCRYCFRRHYPYAEQSALHEGWSEAIEALRREASIEELILSGGDPLSLSDRRLRALTGELLRVPHLRRLRIHTRLPVVLPERVDGELLAWLGDMPWQKVMVLHVNHAREIDDAVARACRDLAGAGVTLLNQSVLLAGVNDCAATLQDLSEALFSIGVLPYYLHLLDRVAGAAHFDVSDERALALHAALLSTLPGYLVPRLVREIPGAASKTAVVGGPRAAATLPATLADPN